MHAIAQKILQDRKKYFDLISLAGAITAKVFENNVNRLFDLRTDVDIDELCKKFRDLLVTHGFDDIPENNSFLYLSIIHPLYIELVGKQL